MIIGLNLMSKIIYILYYSQSGSVKSIANEIIKIFEELDPVDVEIKLMEAENIDFDALKTASGYILGTPNYLSAPSGYIKVFYDEMFQEKAVKGKPVFCFVSHGGSGDIPELIAMNDWLKLKTVGSTVVVRGGNIKDHHQQEIQDNLKEMLKKI